MKPSRSALATLLAVFLAAFVLAQDAPNGDYTRAMKTVAARFSGRSGVVLHVGDSITYSNPYGQWARSGSGQTDDDRTVLRWMHTGQDDDSDGWWLARTDLPGGRSHTACSGLRADELLAGGKSDMPSLARMLEQYKPQIVVLMIGTNDVSANRGVTAYRADVARAVDLILAQNAVCILSTIPPHHAKPTLAKTYNDALRELAKSRQIPLIDFEREILTRRPDDWNGTLLNKDDVHPTAKVGEIHAASEPTEENLRTSGYLLRGWLTVRKIAEVKKRVLDEVEVKVAALPRGEAVKAPVTRDTWFSNVGNEADCNLGGAPRLKVKAHQEMSLIDIDASPFKGRVVTGATLHLRQVGNERIHRLTVSSFGSEWVEGTSPNYAPQNGSSTHKHRKHPDVPWTADGGDLCSVMLGQGGTVWRMADAFAPDAQGWQKVAVDPSVVAARVAGISHGFLLFDDTGSEWTRNGEKFDFRLFPNRFVHSRESGEKNAPYLIVHLGERDEKPPAAPTGLKADNGDLPQGETRLTWITPEDQGAAGTLGFFVTVDGKEVPRYLIPVAGKPSEAVRMHLRDLGLKAGAKVVVAVRAVDGAGNVGPASELAVVVSDRVAKPLPGVMGKPFTEGGKLPKLGDAEVAILDELDKVHPVSGEMIPKQADGYLAANHLWSARDGRVRLHAARNEFVAFQVLLRGKASGVTPTLTFDGLRGARSSFARLVSVNSAKGPLPDPVVPLDGAFDAPANLLCEVYVGHDAPAGEHKGTLRLQAGPQTLELQVTLRVWDFTLPDFLSFLPEMNCYGLPTNERDYYRLAHEHRTVLNRVPYHQNGSIAEGCAPKWDGSRLDWTAYERRFGPYLDGSAFADLPRKSVPIECFYLPMHENWPTPIEGNYNHDYWADRAFPPAYRAALVETSRIFTEHAGRRGWNETLFHFFLNGKNDFKKNGWSRGSSPWLLDEPANWQDYWALRWFGSAFHEGVRKAPGKAKMLFRADISRPMWQRDAFDGLLDYNVVSGVLRNYRRMVLDRKEQNGEILMEYGGSNPIEDANVQPAGWCVDAWAIGADGVLPWQTVGNANSWNKADPLSLFYPARAGGGVTPSIRLKAYRRGQQDVEYLTLLALTTKEPRWAVGQQVREALKLSAERKGTGYGAEDAGMLTYRQLLPQDLWALRVRVGEALSAAKPEPKRKLIDLRTPPRDPSQLKPGYVSIGETPASAKSTEPSPNPEPRRTIVKALQGSAVVSDALIDPTRPDVPLGAEGRNNALRRADHVNALLVRFDLDKLTLPRDARIVRATLTFHVWDPSSKGDTKVCAFPLKTAWDERTATWASPAPGKAWKGDKGFAFEKDAGPPSPHIVVKPDVNGDTADPPIEYTLDVTDLVKAWASGTANHGLAIAPVVDRQIDDGQNTRFQVYTSEWRELKYGPRLSVELSNP